jgi:hypothetical protein
MKGNILSFEQTAIQNAKQLYNLSDKISVTQIPALNKLFLSGETQVAGDPNASAYLLAWRTFANEYARISTTASGGGITTDTARKEMEDAIRKANTPDQMKSVLRQAVLEMKHREYGFDTQLKNIYDRWGGRKGFTAELPTEEDVYQLFATPTPYVVPDKQTGKSTAPAGGGRPPLSSFVR